MRAAPPVSVRGNGGPVWRGVQAVLFALAVGVLVFWGLSLISTPWRVLPALASAAIVGLLAWRLLGRAVSQLSWGGQHWMLQTPPDGQGAVQGRLEVMVDLGRFMLLRLVPATGARRWVAVTAKEAGAQWHALRAAAYARGASQAKGPDSIAANVSEAVR